MQSVLACGRLLSRAFINGVLNVSNGTSVPGQTSAQITTSSASKDNTSSSNSPLLDASKCLKFITAVSGVAKYQSSIRPGKFGDDAFFLASYSKGKILGKYYTKIFHLKISVHK